jgi:hypothetical protein
LVAAVAVEIDATRVVTRIQRMAVRITERDNHHGDTERAQVRLKKFL